VRTLMQKHGGNLEMITPDTEVILTNS